MCLNLWADGGQHSPFEWTLPSWTCVFFLSAQCSGSGQTDTLSDAAFNYTLAHRLQKSQQQSQQNMGSAKKHADVTQHDVKHLIAQPQSTLRRLELCVHWVYKTDLTGVTF